MSKEIDEFEEIKKAIRLAEDGVTAAKTQLSYVENELREICKELGISSVEEIEPRLNKINSALTKAEVEIRDKAKDLGLLH